MVADLEKSTYTTFSVLWLSLSHNQQRFAMAMVESVTKREAAQKVGLQPNTVYGWGTTIDEVVDVLRNQSSMAALGIIQANATKAAMVKTDGLNSEDEKIRQGVATEILDRVAGRPTQRQEIDLDGDFEIRLNWGDRNNDRLE